jgi:hypothetical protein
VVTWAHLERSLAVPHSVLKFFNLDLELRTLYQRLDVRRVAVECRRTVVDRTTVVTELQSDRSEFTWRQGGTRVSVQAIPRGLDSRQGVSMRIQDAT